MAGDREHCLASGMDDYITKPVSTKQLSIALRTWLPEDLQSGADAARRVAVSFAAGPGSAAPITVPAADGDAT